MNRYDIRLLDCSLRDGGYINSWDWGRNRARCIIEKLVQAGIDVVEIGFLRDIDDYNPRITISKGIRELNALIPQGRSNAMYAAMAMVSNYTLDKLEPYGGTGIELIRVTAHDRDMDKLYHYAEEIKNLGYKVSVNPINIMGYADDELLRILERVNKIEPYQFSIVDTFGSMNRENMSRIVRIADNNLNKNIRLGLHLHENMALAYSMAQDLIGMRLQRSLTIDGSLMGIGRTPGNLPLELICDYANNYVGKDYDLDYLLDAIYDYILPLRGEVRWGYSPEFFLSARFNLHRNYAEHYLKKGDLTTKDINHLLSRISKKKASVFDLDYADRIYDEYKDNHIDDSASRRMLSKEIGSREVLIIAPGNSLNTYFETINDYIRENILFVIALNFEPELFVCDYVFFSNHKRYSAAKHVCREIVVSNIPMSNAELCFDFNALSGAFRQGCNGLIMLLKLLKDIGISEIKIVGADGYSTHDNYCDEAFRNYVEHDKDFNYQVQEAIKLLGVSPVFLTPTKYGESVWK